MKQNKGGDVVKYNLSEKQMKAVELLCQGYSITEVAKTVGVDRATVYRWLNHDKRFGEAKELMESQMYESLFAVAVNEMAEILINGNVNQKIPVIQLVAKLNGKVEDRHNVKVENDVDIDKFLESLDKYK